MTIMPIYFEQTPALTRSNPRLDVRIAHIIAKEMEFDHTETNQFHLFTTSMGNTAICVSKYDRINPTHRQLFFSPTSNLEDAMLLVAHAQQKDYWFSASYKTKRDRPDSPESNAAYHVTFRCVRGRTRPTYTGVANTLQEATSIAYLNLSFLEYEDGPYPREQE
jgi:hypothetical protein